MEHEELTPDQICAAWPCGFAADSGPSRTVFSGEEIDQLGLEQLNFWECFLDIMTCFDIFHMRMKWNMDMFMIFLHFDHENG